MSTPVLAEALVRWQHAAGPFWPYICAAPFLGTGEGTQLAALVAHRASITGSRPPRYSRRHLALADKLLVAIDVLPCSLARGSGLGGGGVPAGTHATPRVVESWGGGFSNVPERSDSFPVILADLPAEPLLAVAPLLAERGWYVVPVVQRWIATPAVLPCRRLVERMLVGAWRAQRPAQPRGAIMIADGERTGPVGYPQLPAGRTFDNRYEYQICRFPSTRFLHAQGVRQVTWITAERPPTNLASGVGEPTLGIPPVARDLHPYRELLLQAGIDVAVTQWQPG